MKFDWKTILIVLAVAIGGYWLLNKIGVLGKKAAGAVSMGTDAVASGVAAARRKLSGLVLDQNTSGVTKTTGTAAVMTDLAVWAVPRKARYIFRGGTDSISAFLKDAAAESVGTDSWQLVKRAPAGLGFDEVVAQGQYTQIKEFQDRNKTFKLPTTVELGEDWKLVLQAKLTTVSVVASCYYAITGLQELEV